jgi:glucosamine--fructose-6-phosphate aminotransferase (isomerizing)
MCGIIGYVGSKNCTELILEGLQRLEYRGYDSAGIAVIADDDLHIRRSAGKLVNLANNLRTDPLTGTTGVGHTRWATHGAPTEENAHPHRAGDVVVVHNGIIENHKELKDELKTDALPFTSETDTEIIAHLIHRERAKGLDLPEAVRSALSEVRGAYAIAVLDRTEPDRIIAAKNASPLVVGIGDGENYLASDIPAILPHTREMIFLGEGEMAILTQDDVSIVSIEDGEPIASEPQTITWSPAMAEKGGYKHFMLKEIHEQPRAMVDTLRGRVRIEHDAVDLPGITLDDAALKAIDRVVIVACGTSWHAALIGETLIEQFVRIPTEVELASEFRYRKPVVNDKTLVIAISQSGETADTLAAIAEAKKSNTPLVGVCNVIGSTLTRQCESMVMTHAGPEVGVASTKAFATQIGALYMLALRIAQARRTMTSAEIGEHLQDLIEIPSRMEEIIQGPTDVYKALARKLHHTSSMLYLGRGLSYPVALEGALKLKELSYIHAEGYAAGEMKHGPIALIDEDIYSVVVCPEGPHFEKTLSNVAEINTRGGSVIAVTTEGAAAERVSDEVDTVITVPAVREHLQPLLTMLPMQLLAYYVADFKGTDVDQPRNLAKSVTVE